MHPKLKLDHIHFRSSNFEETRHFYIDILGAKDKGTVTLGEEEHLRFRIASRTLLFAPDNREKKNPAISNGEKLGVYHIAFLVKNCKKTTEYYKSKGATFAIENKEISGLTVSFINAPDGMTVELKEVLK